MATKIDRERITERARELSEQARERNRERLESNSEYQRGQTMTAEQRHRGAVDRMTKLNIEYAAKNGRELTDSRARAFAQAVGQENLRRGK